MTEGEEDVVAAAAADIICSLRGADLGGWTPPWRSGGVEASVCPEAAAAKEEDEEELVAAWPAVARGKRSRSRRRSPSGSGSAAKGRWARGSPASPLDDSGGSGASTSGGEDGAFCSPPAPVASRRATHPAPPPSTKMVVAAVSSAGSGRRPPPPPPPSTTTTTIVPVPPAPRPGAAGQRSRKKMRLPEVQQLVRSLTVENAGLREEMESLRRACTALSKENGKLEIRLEHSSGKRKRSVRAEEEKEKEKEQKSKAKKLDQGSQNGFVLPDLNIPAEDFAVDGSAAPS